MHLNLFSWCCCAPFILMLFPLEVQNYVVRSGNLNIERSAIYRRYELLNAQINIVEKTMCSFKKYILVGSNYPHFSVRAIFAGIFMSNVWRNRFCGASEPLCEVHTETTLTSGITGSSELSPDWQYLQWKKQDHWKNCIHVPACLMRSLRWW